MGFRSLSDFQFNIDALALWKRNLVDYLLLLILRIQLETKMLSEGNSNITVLVLDNNENDNEDISLSPCKLSHRRLSLILATKLHEIQIPAIDPNYFSERKEIEDKEEILHEKTIHQQRFRLWYKYRGIFFALCSSLIFSATALFVKKLKEHNPITIALWRYQGAFWPGMACLVYHTQCSSKSGVKNTNNVSKVFEEISPPSQKLKTIGILLARSFLTCNALLLHFYSLKFLEIGDAIVITSATPIAVTIFSRIFRQEVCGIIPIISAFLSVIGILIISKPPHLTGAEEFDLDAVYGLTLGLGSMLLASFSYIALRYLRKVHYTVTTIAFSTWGTLENLTLALGFGVLSIPVGTDLTYAILLVLFTFIGQLSIIFATKYELASIVSLIRTMDCIVCFFLQYVFLGVDLNTFSLIGSSVVILGVLITTFRKYLLDLAPDNDLRKFFFFLLY